MNIKIKLLSKDAVVPTYAHEGEDACFDLTATSIHYDEQGNVVYGCGVAFEIPTGFVGLVFPRSSICKKDISLTNCVGVIDSGYRNEVFAKFKKNIGFGKTAEDLDLNANVYQIGERFAQMMIIPIPTISFDVVDELSESSRGKGGYGSSDKK